MENNVYICFYKSQDDTKNILDMNPLNSYNSNKKEKNIIS